MEANGAKQERLRQERSRRSQDAQVARVEASGAQDIKQEGPPVRRGARAENFDYSQPARRAERKAGAKGARIRRRLDPGSTSEPMSE